MKWPEDVEEPRSRRLMASRPLERELMVAEPSLEHRLRRPDSQFNNRNLFQSQIPVSFDFFPLFYEEVLAPPIAPVVSSSVVHEGAKPLLQNPKPVSAAGIGLFRPMRVMNDEMQVNLFWINCSRLRPLTCRNRCLSPISSNSSWTRTSPRRKRFVLRKKGWYMRDKEIARTELKYIEKRREYCEWNEYWNIFWEKVIKGSKLANSNDHWFDEKRYLYLFERETTYLWETNINVQGSMFLLQWMSSKNACPQPATCCTHWLLASLMDFYQNGVNARHWIQYQVEKIGNSLGKMYFVHTLFLVK